MHQDYCDLIKLKTSGCCYSSMVGPHIHKDLDSNSSQIPSKTPQRCETYLCEFNVVSTLPYLYMSDTCQKLFLNESWYYFCV